MSTDAATSRLLPSSLADRFMPNSVRSRLGERATHGLNKGLSIADAIWLGEDDNAHSLRMALIAFVVRVTSAFIAYVSQVAIARWLGTYEYGIFVWVWTATILMGGFVSLGFPSSITRFVPEYQINGDNGRLRGVIFGTRMLATLFATVFAAAGIAIIWSFPSLSNNIYFWPLLLGATCLPMLSLSEVQDGVARSFNWVNLAMSPTFLIRPTMVLAVLGAALLAGFEATAQMALIASIAGTWITTIGQMWLLDRRLKTVVPKEKRTYSLRLWLAVSLPILLVDSFFNLLTNVDILIAGYYLPPQQVGIYFAAVKTLALVHFVFFAVRASAAHRYAKYYKQGDRPRLIRYVHDTIRWIFWPSVGMGLFMLVAGKPLISLFGPDFAPAYGLLFVLIIGVFARAAVGPAESLLNMTGHQKSCAAIYGLTLLVNVLLNLSLIPRFGIEGAAWGTTVAMMFEAIALYTVVLRCTGIHMFVFAPLPDEAKDIDTTDKEADNGSV